MHSRVKWRRQIKLAWSLLALLSCLSIAAFGFAVSQDHETATTVLPSPPAEPQFHVNDCFQRNGLREPWDTDEPDGIVAMKGTASYLIMFHEEANRKSGGAKVALPLTITTFDATHHKVECPTTWLTHNRRNHG